MYLTTKAGALS